MSLTAFGVPGEGVTASISGVEEGAVICWKIIGSEKSVGTLYSLGVKETNCPEKLETNINNCDYDSCG